ncbi:MAG: glycosyltransferase [Acidobacteriota bacterium]|nr:glycosyltransferase [Acidobacteriota bacterium]
MHSLALAIFGSIAFFWIFFGLRIAYGALQLPWLKDFNPAPNQTFPRISLLFAARDEEEKLPAALDTLAKLDYPNLEIIGVDDRSQDATGQILDDFAATNPTFRAIRVRELPADWLGKPHALQQAYEASSGEWLLFTDADVRFAPDVLRRAVIMAMERKLDHLTLFGDVEMVGFWETVLITFFGMAFQLATNPNGISNPKSQSYMGVGAFQLVKRNAYEASGTHKRLAMEVIDDMKLGKIVKQAGFCSGAGIAQDALVVRWHAGVRNLIQGVTKNFFAGSGFSVPTVIFSIAALIATNILPFAGLIFGHGWIRILAGVAVFVAVCMHAGVDIVFRVSPLYSLTVPIGAMLFGYMLARSTVITLKQGGIIWRGTFYPLEQLKRGAV